MSETRIINVPCYADDIILVGPNAPPATNIDDLLRYCATIFHRFGNTAVTFGLEWGGSALRSRDEQGVEIEALHARMAALERQLAEANATIGRVKTARRMSFVEHPTRVLEHIDKALRPSE